MADFLQRVIPCQENQHLSLGQAPRGSPFYQQFIFLADTFDVLDPGIMVLGKNGDYIITSTVGFESILQDLRKCDRVFYLIGVTKDATSGTSIENTAHAMAIVIDPRNKILEVFDPNGINPDTRHVYLWSTQLINFLRDHGIELQRKITADEPFCPQGVSSFAPQFRGEQQCLVWSYWYIWLRANNPQIPGDAIRRSSSTNCIDRI